MGIGTYPSTARAPRVAIALGALVIALFAAAPARAVPPPGPIARPVPPGAAGPTLSPQQQAAVQADLAAASATRQAVVDAAGYYLGTPYLLEFGWTCSYDAMDCECLNRHAIWDGTYSATGSGLQLWYTLRGQIDEGWVTDTPRPGDLIFWDLDKSDGDYGGGDYDHTGVYIGGNTVIEANAYWGEVEYNSVSLSGTSYDYFFVDVLSPYGY